ncbi:MAG: hypothetical protein ACYC63_07830 [Armatimonadota bacterium]
MDKRLPWLQGPQQHGWVITRVFHADDQRCVGVSGPSDSVFTAEHIKASPDKQQFRLLDDDGGIMAYGYYLGSDGEELFSPLEDYGRGNWGCTEIQYKDEHGKWETI